MNVIVAGGRDFMPDDKHKSWLIEQLRDLRADTIVCGMAKGADLFGRSVGLELGLTILEFPAMWDLYGRSAGPRRNIQMAELADACILFPGGKGTEHMEKVAISRNLVLRKYEPFW
jgi:predicted Rossmann-fold nucleotide-binding protein